MDAISRKRILIIDRDVEMGKLYTIILSEDFEVFHVESARDMKEQFAGMEFDMFVVGYQLPPGNVLDLIQAERDLFGGKPIIMITGEDVRLIAKKAYRLGVSAILQKPYSVTDLLDKVRSCLRERVC